MESTYTTCHIGLGRETIEVLHGISRKDKKEKREEHLDNPTDKKLFTSKLGKIVSPPFSILDKYINTVATW